MTESDSFAVLLRQYRLEAGLTQKALAERAFVSSKSIGSLERDRYRLPRLETVRVLAEALKLDQLRRERFLAAARPSESAAAESYPILLSLPAPSTPLYGRERDLQLVCRFLAEAFDGTASRMIVLTGPGGVGKTRLALAASHRCASVLADNVAFVDLTSVHDATMVMEAIARQIGVADRDPIPVRNRVVSLLRQRPSLLLLDNIEHLTEARAELVSLLDDCPGLVLLLTSRVPLGVRAERQMRLAPLDGALPQASMAELVQAPSVNLFIDRARAAGWMGDSTNALPTIAEICQRLDGLPLAIELAAAWTNFFAPVELLRRLQQRLPLLTRGRHDMPERHQTMGAAVAWSYRLLVPAMQGCFRRACIFENGAPLSTVCALLSKPGDTLQIEGQLAELADQSLISWQATETKSELESELHILETIREFGVDQLREAKELLDVTQKHADLMLALAERVSGELGGPNEAPGLRQLDREYVNVRAALSRCIANGDRDRSLRFVAALWRFWALQGRLTEGAARMKEAIALLDGNANGPTSAGVSALTGAALLAIELGDLESADQYVDRSVDTARSSPNSPGLASALYAAGLLASQRGDNARAGTLLHQALERARIELDAQSEAGILGELAQVAFRTGNPPLAEAIELDRLAQCRRLGDRRGVALSTKNLALYSMYAGRFDAAQRFASESATELSALGDTGILAEVLWSLGHMAYLQGDLDIAEDHLATSHAMRLARGDERNAAKSSGVLAVIEIARSNYEHARVLVEEADAPLREQQDRFGLAMNSMVRGHIEIATGNRTAATLLLNEGGELMLAMNNVQYLPWYLEGIAVVATQNQDWVLAAKLLGALEELTLQGNSALPLVRPVAFEAARYAVWQALGEASFDQLMEEGKLDPIGIARAQC